jgi:hypothetical protein
VKLQILGRGMPMRSQTRQSDSERNARLEKKREISRLWNSWWVVIKLPGEFIGVFCKARTLFCKPYKAQGRSLQKQQSGVSTMNQFDEKTLSQRLRPALALICVAALASGCGGDKGDDASAEDKSAYESMTEAAGNAMDSAGETMGDMADSAESTMSDAADAVSETASDAVDAMEEAADDAADAISEQADAAGAAMKEAADDAEKAMGEMADDAEKAMGEMTEDAEKKAADMKKKVDTNVDET